LPRKPLQERLLGFKRGRFFKPGGAQRTQTVVLASLAPLAPGHRIRLDLTQVDQPYLRPNNLTNAIHFGVPKLVLPTREAQNQTLTGSP